MAELIIIVACVLLAMYDPMFVIAYIVILCVLSVFFEATFGG